MPLSEQLKSEMTGIPSDASPEKESGQPAAEPVQTPELSGVQDTEDPIAQPKDASLHKPPAPPPDQTALLLSIETQLKALGDQLSGLQQAVSESRNPDFRTVFAKIDAACTSMEKLISENRQPDPETAPTGAELLALLRSILEKQEKNDRQLVESLRDNENF